VEKEAADVSDTSSEEESGGSETAALTDTAVPSEPPASSEKGTGGETARKETHEASIKKEEPKPRSLAQILRFERKVVKRRR
jgi:hypothetical protein